MKTLVVILGATGVGKTRVGISLAEVLSSPIVNADSRQIYRDIPIGTAAPTAEEQRRVFHYFVGTMGLEVPYSAAQYEADALRIITREFQRRNVLVMSGGAMLYINAVCNGVDDIPAVPAGIRNLMHRRLAEEGLPVLQKELETLDPVYYASCDLKNPLRVMHALEICHLTNRPYSTFLTGKVKSRPFRILRIGLRRERQELFQRINDRVDAMMEAGLLEEARLVQSFRGCNALNTVGYKELFNYFDGKYSLDEAVEKIKRNTRVYAKKQMTWFGKNASTVWFHPDADAEIRNFIMGQLG